MYLKSLEIHGFKSFADKTKLEFGPGVTCIVGPNGSGKSNVCDALRWVLGEQSIKTLRGAKLEDIIFNGSEGRKPLGMAAVTLVFDNSSGLLPLEFTEVTVSRRVFRSGESEFFINKTPCRLKDIQELFNDTGLGRDAFAIIGQGQVDAVLSSRPEERRALFEEAAGIVRYRNRKTEALRKLENTDTNLARLQDLLYELEQNLLPLQKEAEKVKLYDRYKSELATLEINLACFALGQIMEQREAINAKVADSRTILLEKEKVAAAVAARLQAAQLAKANTDQKERDGQEELHRLQREMATCENNKVVALERQTGIVARVTAINEEQALNLTRIGELKNKYGREDEEFKLLTVKKQQWEKEVARQEQELQAQGEQLLQYRKDKQQLTNMLFDLEQSLASLHNRELEIQFNRKDLEQRQKRLHEGERQHGEIKQQLEQGMAACFQKIEDKTAIYRRLMLAQQNIAGQRNTIKTELPSLLKEKEELQRACLAAQSRVRVLTEMRDNLDGYQIGVRNLLTSPGPKENNGLIGAVGNLLKVPGHYERAIETALGGALQFIVAQTDRDAQQAIAWLKREKAGRATFLPLNTLRPRPASGTLRGLLGEIGVIGLAADLVESQPEQQVVVAYLLGNILVVKDLTIGMELAQKSRFSVKMVTLDGDLIAPGGSLTGGRQKRDGHGFLGREREIAHCRGRLQELTEQKAVIEQACRLQLQQDEKLRVANDNITAKMNAVQLEIRSLELEHQKIAAELKDNETGLNRWRWEKGQIADEQQVVATQLTDLAGGKAEKQANKIALSERLKQVTEVELSLEAESKALKNSLLEGKLELASLREKLKGLASTLAYYTSHQQELTDAQKRLTEELKQLIRRQEETKTLAATLERDLAQLRAVQLEQEKAQKTWEVDRARNLSLLNALSGEAEQLNEAVKMQQEQYHRLEMQGARLEVEWENAAQRLQENHHLTWEEAQKIRVALAAPGAAQARVGALRQDIAALGTINPNAIEEFQRLQERHGFLKEQYEDLLAGKEGLLQIVKEMEKVMQQRFRETYRAIEIAFQEVFAYLFDGGKATLELTDPGEILTSGIEIIAHLPGKQKQHLSLLSGGERALTAAALLFALLKVRPSPFCVLDEIEANLDEVNVERFAAYLREFTAETQFILVSHRQGTMEVADVLYGVAMGETGVSRLLSVKMSAAQEVG